MLIDMCINMVRLGGGGGDIQVLGVDSLLPFHKM